MSKRLTKKTEEAIKKLAEETKHQLSLEDWADIAELDEIGKRIANPSDLSEWDIVDAPVWAGRVKLYPMTLSAFLWLQERGIPWFEKSSLYLDVAIAFVLSKSYNMNDVWRLRGRRETLKAISKFWRKAHCSRKELERAFKVICPQEDTKEDQEAAAYGPVIASMVKNHGHTKDYWMNEASIKEIVSLLNSDAEQAQAETYAQWQASRRSTGKGRVQQAPPPWFMEYNTKFTNKLNEMRAKWQM